MKGKKELREVENHALKLKVFIFVQFIHKRENQDLIGRLDSHRLCGSVMSCGTGSLYRGMVMAEQLHNCR